MSYPFLTIQCRGKEIIDIGGATRRKNYTALQDWKFNGGPILAFSLAEALKLAAAMIE